MKGGDVLDDGRVKKHVGGLHPTHAILLTYVYAVIK